MKLQCKQCGKREAELLSKAEIKVRLAPSVAEKVFDLVRDLASPKFIVCNACGHYESA